MDRRLTQFLAVAEAGNVSAAAAALNVSQPTISVNIRKLEEEHGVPLFTRSSRGVVLTEFGKVLCEHVRVMARLNDHAKAEIRAMKQANRPSLKIACGFTWWHLFVRDAIRDCATDAPDAALHVDICSSLDGLRHLMSGDVSCFIGTRVDNITGGMGFRFAPLLAVEDAYFTRQDHPLIGQVITRRDLSAYPRMDVAPFVNRHFGIAEPTGTPGLWPKEAPAHLSTNSMTAGIGMLKDSEAYLIYPMLTQEYFAAQGIGMLNVSDRPTHKIQIGTYTLAEKTPSELQIAFLDRITQVVAGERMP
ncbi:LysR family transcriptional regulator [uncultured Tateyamaria sp.]|uniref:LysR family transcriptional regulator n=1 Tax=uncultured Tateyamaria sp. TaxID=455651 RepID=UPI0026189F6D|nr:LysR family transcriptional regulator [uncultured Tateyamaria sp.]